MIPAPTLDLCRKAANKALRFHEDHVVVDIDHEDDRREEVHPAYYLNEDEFHAFGGTLVAIVYPDGRMDYYGDEV